MAKQIRSPSRMIFSQWSSFFGKKASEWLRRNNARAIAGLQFEPNYRNPVTDAIADALSARDKEHDADAIWTFVGCPFQTDVVVFYQSSIPYPRRRQKVQYSISKKIAIVHVSSGVLVSPGGTSNRCLSQQPYAGTS